MKKNKNLYIFLISVISVAKLHGAIGCQKIEHTVNYWNVSKPKFVQCSCPCNTIVTDFRGQCTQCGHYGSSNRGEISKRVLAEYGLAHN